MKDKPVQVGEHFFNYKISNTLIGVWEVKKSKRGTFRAAGDRGISFVVPFSVEWLDRTRVAELILRKISN